MTSASRAGRWLGAGAAAYAVLFTALAWRRQDSFEYGRFDLGNMAQTVWNTAHGRVLEMSDVAGQTFTRLGVHVDPILAAFAPAYRIWPDPKLLLVAQAAFVASGAWPAYRLARAELGTLVPAGAAAALAGAWLLYPPLQWATLDEFHPVTLAAPLLLFAIWFLRERRYAPFAVAAVAATLCKEEVGLVVAVLGLYAAFVWGDRRAGLIAAAAGTAWSAFAFGVVIPHYSPTEAGPFAERYAAVGGDIPGILETAVTDPLRLAEEAFSGRDLGYLGGQLAPLLALPLLAPVALLVAVPELAANLLSGQHSQSSWRFHYVAVPATVFWWAALLGLRRVLVWRAGRAAARAGPSAVGGRPAAVWLVPAACVVAGYFMGPLPWWSELPGGSDTRAGSYNPDGHDEVAARVAERLPANAPISVANRMGAHPALAHRRHVALFPELGDARYVIVDRRNASFGEANAGGAPEARGPVTREQEAALARLLRSKRWAGADEVEGVVVLTEREAGRR